MGAGSIGAHMRLWTLVIELEFSPWCMSCGKKCRKDDDDGREATRTSDISIPAS
jgi:hypothetical protein